MVMCPPTDSRWTQLEFLYDFASRGAARDGFFRADPGNVTRRI